MKKILTGLFIMLLSHNLYATETCPLPSQVFVKEGDHFIPRPPAGWKFSNWPSHLDSDNVTFHLAAYGADLHPPTDADNHVRCYYGNPDLTVEHGVGIETIAIIPEDQISSHPEWYTNEHYHLCASHSNNVNDCPYN